MCSGPCPPGTFCFWPASSVLLVVRPVYQYQLPTSIQGLGLNRYLWTITTFTTLLQLFHHKLVLSDHRLSVATPSFTAI